MNKSMRVITIEQSIGVESSQKDPAKTPSGPVLPPLGKKEPKESVISLEKPSAQRKG